MNKKHNTAISASIKKKTCEQKMERLPKLSKALKSGCERNPEENKKDIRGISAYMRGKAHFRPIQPTYPTNRAMLLKRD